MNDKQKIPQASEPVESYQIGSMEAISNENNAELKQLLEKANQESA